MVAIDSSPLIRVGPAGWDFRHWDGVVYPRAALRRLHPLEFLADRFDCLEIPATFKRALRPELASLWATRVRHNPNFRFTARLQRDFTHERLVDPVLAEQFCAGLRPLAGQGLLGALLMQFPFSFRFTQENKDHLIRLRRLFHEFPLVAELRHDSWTSTEALGTLIDYHVGFANLDQPERMRATRAASILTTGIGYVKLHGRECGAHHFEFDDRAARVTGNHYLYSLRQLEEWKGRVSRLSEFAQEVYVVFNNDGAGKSVVNGLQMRGLLGSRVEAARFLRKGNQTAMPELFASAA